MSAQRSQNPEVRPASAFAHPLFLGALALLALNDHVLKGSGLLPGWLTGKLSDFAGLVFAPPLFAAVLRVRTRRGLALATATVGVVFTALELSAAATSAARAVYAAFGLTWRSWSDPTDLLALAMLPVAYALVVRTSRGALGRAGTARGELAVGIAGVVASIATTPSMEPTTCTSDTYDCDADGYGTPDDCDDYNPGVFPGQGCLPVNAEDVCDDGLDQDGDLLVDCDDPDCASACADLEATCSTALAIDLATTTSLVGSTSVGTSVTDGTCIGADAPEVVFHVVAPSAGSLTIGLPAGHGVHVRERCAAAFTELACATPDQAGDSLTVSMAAGQDLTVVIEAEDPLLSGPFEAPLTFAPEGCSDAGATPLEVGSTTATFGTDVGVLQSSCAGGQSGARRFFVFTPSSDGTLSLVVSSPSDVVLSARPSCSAAESTCSNDAGVGGIESLAVPVVASVPVLLFVERLSGDATEMTLTATLTAP